MPDGRPPTGQAGFSLIEALVALTVLGTVLIPLFGLVTQSLDSLRRTGAAHREAADTLAVLGAIEGINPMLQPSGVIDAGAFRIAWEATPLADPLPNQGFGRPGRFLVGLYALRIAVSGPDDRQFTLDTRQVGYRRIDDAPAR